MDSFTYEVIRSSRKDLRLQITDSGLRVLAPSLATKADIEKFLHRHRRWIYNRLAARGKARPQIEQEPPMSSSKGLPGLETTSKVEVPEYRVVRSKRKSLCLKFQGENLIVRAPIGISTEVIEEEPTYESQVLNDPIYALRMDDKIVLKNLAPWPVGFRKMESVGEVNINAGGTVRVSRGEVVAQAENGNRLIAGIDGAGSHATVLINDKVTRDYLGWKDQLIVSAKLVKEIFNESDDNDFKARMMELVTTRCEKQFVKDIIVKEGLENTIPYGRVKFALDLCKTRF